MARGLGSKVGATFVRLVNATGIRAVKDGMMCSIPMIAIGSAFLLLLEFPIASVASFIESLGLVPYLEHAYTSTFQVIALITTLGVACTHAKYCGCDPLSCAAVAIGVFLVLIPDHVSGEVAVAGGEVLVVSLPGLDKTWLAGQGMVAAIVAGLLTGESMRWFMQHDLYIRMPESVPESISVAFTGLVPCAAILTLTSLAYLAVDIAFGRTPVELIYDFLQAPLSGITDNLAGALVHSFLVPLFWWFGVHGAAVMASVLTPILQANMIENAELVRSGTELTTQNAHILTECLWNSTGTVTGSGITLGLVLYMVFFAKSSRMRQVGRLGLGSGLFNINEPVLFGTPLVMNTKMIVPFVLVPTVAYGMTYLMTLWGLLPITYLAVPWTTPPIISGLLIGGWRLAAWQIVEIVWSFAAYLPCARALDMEYLALERTGGEEANSGA